MRKFIFLLAILALSLNVSSQTLRANKSPFDTLGYKKPIMFSSSRDQFKEFHDQTDIVEIGSVLFDTRTNQVVGFIDEEQEKIEVPASTPSISVDPLCTQYYWITPYHYCLNNPVNRVDPDGRADYYFANGKRVGTDGNNDGLRIVVTNNTEAKTLSKIKGNIDAANVTSGFTLPSDAALNESLNVLGRTVNNGGKREESSLVMNNGQIARGETGPYQAEGASVLTATMPDIPAGLTAADVEVSIHSHATAMDWDRATGDVTFSSSATKQGPGDPDIFKDFQMNIIVGPLGAPSAGSKEVVGGRVNPPYAQPNGVVFYNNVDKDPVFQLTEKAVKKILGE